MSMSGDEAYVLAMDYVDETLEGGGALKGDDGKSAYQSWLDLGNTGTEEDFINSLKGEKGQVGEKGETGNDGKSSYEIWLDNGNVGTEQDFLDSLKGEGTDGFSPVITENSNNTDEDYRLDIETKESKFTTPNLKADISKNMSEHNTSPDSHNDIRIFLNELNNRLNALANSDDETLDEMKEVVAYIKDNRSLIESITTTKVNVADIIDNLTTNVSNKPLSASQGVVIKNLIDTLQSDLTAHTNNADIHVTASKKTEWDAATNKINDLKIADVNGLQAELSSKPQRIDLSGSIQKEAYRCSVIALCRTNPIETGSNSSSSGKLFVRRSNGLGDCNSIIDLFIGEEFFRDYGITASISETSFNGAVHVRPCTFKYNEVTYGGIELFIHNANSENVIFDGYTNFSIFGLDYFDTEKGTILNEEVFNSLNFDNVTYSKKLYYNLKKVYTEDNLKVGGRNLIDGIYTYGFLNNVTVTDDNKIKIDYSADNTIDCYFLVNMHSNFVLGEEYTISFDVENLEGDAHVYIGIPDNVLELKNGRVYKTFVASEGIVHRYANQLLIDNVLNSVTSKSNNILLSNFKLEKGNVATDWTPAPEDLQPIADNTQVSRFNLQSPGWHRIAEYRSSHESNALGSAANGLEIFIKRVYNELPNEMHKLLLQSHYNSQKFSSIASSSDNDEYRVITAIRYVRKGTAAYIDIWYNTYTMNEISVLLSNCVDMGMVSWKTITPYHVSDTVEGTLEGETVSTVFDIPANANPVTDLDLTIDAIQGLRAELNELRSLITNS